MSDPVSLQILEALQTRLQAIAPNGGYNTDAGDRVYLGRRRFNPDELDIGPVIHVYDTDDQVDEITAYGDESMHVTMTVNVDAFQRNVDDLATRNAHLLIQDIRNALLKPTDRTLSGLTLDFGYAGRSVDYPDPGGDTVGVSCQFVCLYLEPYGLLSGD